MFAPSHSADVGDFGPHGPYTLGLNSATSIMGQEAGHRWAAFVPFVHPVTVIGPDSLDLLGRGLAHWSVFFNVTVPSSQFGGDPRSSSSEGNAIVDFGGTVFGDCLNPSETRFRTERNELVDGYTHLDQYLLGPRLASDIGPFWYVEQPTRPVAGPSFEDLRDTASIDDVGICGKRVSRAVSFCPASGRARKLDSIVWNSWWSSFLAPGSVHDSREVGFGAASGRPIPADPLLS